jgi:hypothetical protein
VADPGGGADAVGAGVGDADGFGGRFASTAVALAMTNAIARSAAR